MAEPPTKPACPACGAESRDHLLCRKCTAQLRGALLDIAPRLTPMQALVAARSAPGKLTAGGRQTLPWEDQRGSWTGLDDQLMASMAKTGRSGGRTGGRSASVPLPLDLGAVSARIELRNALARWVGELNLGPGGTVLSGWPADTITAMGAWMLDRLQVIRGHAQAADIKRDVCSAVGQARRVINAPASSQQLVGRCDVCGGDIYAAPSSDMGACRSCERVVTGVAVRRGAMLSAAEDKLVTKREALSVLPSMYGVEVSDTRFRKWVSRGRLSVSGCDVASRVELFRVADLLDLVHGEVRRAALKETMSK